MLVALEVAQVRPYECTLAWRVLEHREWVRPWIACSEPEPSTPALLFDPELASRDEADLLKELESLCERGEQLLLQDVPQEASERFAHLAQRSDAGLARLVHRNSPWSELPSIREGGAYWSFATRSNDYNDEPDLGLEGGYLRVGFVVRDTGLVVDLGEQPLPTGLDSLDARAGEPLVDMALNSWIDRSQPKERIAESVDALEERLRLLEAWRVEAQVGHSYLVRSMHREHDLLAVIEVLQLDERGILIAWQVLRTWPNAEPR